MNLDLTGKTAIVCGSTQGLGYASAVELALLGATVVLMARNEVRLQEKVKTLDTKYGQKHSYLVADFDEPHNVKQAMDGFIAAGNTAQILVHNTGGPAGGTALEASPEAFLKAVSYTQLDVYKRQQVNPVLFLSGFQKQVPELLQKWQRKYCRGYL